MIYDVDLEKILFLDIETVPQFEDHSKLSEKEKDFWEKKSNAFRKEQSPEEVYERAGIYSEFGKIVCISVGLIRKKNNVNYLRLKSFYNDDEKVILTGFKELLKKHFNTDKHMLCGHNGKEFDFPYIGRRMLINGIKLPLLLDIAGKKPWEVNHLDTMELWKFGDYKHYTSLNLLTHIFNIPTPKDDIDGSEVRRVYWEEKNIKRIAEYCAKDVKATVQLFLRFRGEDLIPEENIEIVE